MSSQSPEEAPEKRTYRKMPERLEHELLKALMENIRAYGNRCYDDVRERPEFAPWVGKASGDAGSQRFKRYVRQIKRPLPPDRTKPHRGREFNDEQMAWAGEQLERGSNATATLPPSVRQVAAGGLPAMQGWAELEQMLQTSAEDIERIRAISLVEDSAAPGGYAAGIPALLAKAVALRFQCIEAVLRFYERFNAVASDSGVISEFLRYLKSDLLADDPAKFQAALSAYRRILQQHGGVPAGGA